MNPPLPLNPITSAFFGEMNAIQPQWNISEDTRGLLEGTITYRVQTDPLNPGVPRLPSRGEPHPWDDRLRCHSSNSQFSEQGQVMVTAQYIGLQNDPTLAEIEMSASASMQSLQLHPGFTSLAMATPPNATNSNYDFYPYVDTVNDNRKDFERFNAVTAPEGLKGADSYYAPRGTVRVTFYTANAGTATRYVSNVGTITGSIPNANGPMPSGHNYLLANVSVSTFGVVYKISAEWMMSEQGYNWSKVIYRGFGSGGRSASGPKYTLGADFKGPGASWTF
jgi:hypothetical protein